MPQKLKTMKITEVTDKNAQWALLSDIDFSNIYSSYSTIKQAWPVIINSKSPSLIAVHKHNIATYLNLLTEINNKLANFPDKTDPDLTQIKSDINKMIEYINQILS